MHPFVSVPSISKRRKMVIGRLRKETERRNDIGVFVPTHLWWMTMLRAREEHRPAIFNDDDGLMAWSTSTRRRRHRRRNEANPRPRSHHRGSLFVRSSILCMAPGSETEYTPTPRGMERASRLPTVYHVCAIPWWMISSSSLPASRRPYFASLRYLTPTKSSQHIDGLHSTHEEKF